MTDENLLFATTVLLLCLPAATSYSDGNIRLVGGALTRQGRVEIWYNSRWNTVCDDFWDYNDATVVCQQLGYRGAETAHLGAHFGQGSGNILLDDLLCTGREASLLECPHNGINSHNCWHGEDASVTCMSTWFSSGSLRLANGNAPSEGRVEIWYSNQWNTVCDDHWDISDANVVCHQLGYGGAVAAHQSAYFGQGSGQILLDDVQCTGTETSLFSCSHRGTRIHNCGHSEDASVTCGCSDPGTSSHITRTLTGMAIGDTVTYTCQTGYTLSGSSYRTCLSNGDWSGTLPSCTPITCSVPSTPSNGGRIYRGRNYNDRVTFSCNTGYLLRGSRSRTCQSNGLWSETQPICVIITCNSPAPPVNGSVTVDADIVEYGSVANYTCDTGFLLQGNSYRVCQGIETWSGSEPSCQVVRCPDLEELPNGHFTGNSTSYQSTALYECGEGYMIIGAALRTCGATGQWSSSMPTCANSSAIIGGSFLVVILAIGTLVVILITCCLSKAKVCCRVERKQGHFTSTAKTMSAIDSDGNDNCNKSIPEYVDEPVFASIELAIATDKTMPVLEEKAPVYANATSGLPSNESESQAHYCNLRSNAPSGSMCLASDSSPSHVYASLDEAGIQKEGEYCTVTMK